MGLNNPIRSQIDASTFGVTDPMLKDLDLAGPLPELLT